jgi:hypothetical protein
MHKSHHNARVRHILSSTSGQGKPPAKKKFGGSAGMRHVGYARGNDSAHLDEPEIEAEGHKGRHRYAKGGKVKRPMKVQINHINVAHPGMMGAGGPPMPAGPAPMAGAPPMAGLGPGLPAGPMPVRNQGGAVSYGSGTGMSRLAEYHRLKGEGR